MQIRLGIGRASVYYRPLNGKAACEGARRRVQSVALAEFDNRQTTAWGEEPSVCIRVGKRERRARQQEWLFTQENDYAGSLSPVDDQKIPSGRGTWPNPG